MIYLIKIMENATDRQITPATFAFAVYQRNIRISLNPILLYSQQPTVENMGT